MLNDFVTIPNTNMLSSKLNCTDSVSIDVSKYYLVLDAGIVSRTY